MRTVPTGVHLRESADGAEHSRIIAGYAILFGQESEPMWQEDNYEVREVIDPGAITRELLDASDIKFTMFHNPQLILARSRQGQGTLSYDIDAKGVSFEFEAPATVDGDKAVELVRRGVLSGCSFAFSTYYNDLEYVKPERRSEGGRSIDVYHVRKVVGIYDMTITDDPAYTGTSVETRSLASVFEHREPAQWRAQVAEMRQKARF